MILFAALIALGGVVPECDPPTTYTHSEAGGAAPGWVKEVHARLHAPSFKARMTRRQRAALAASASLTVLLDAHLGDRLAGYDLVQRSLDVPPPSGPEFISLLRRLRLPEEGSGTLCKPSRLPPLEDGLLKDEGDDAPAPNAPEVHVQRYEHIALDHDKITITIKRVKSPNTIFDMREIQISPSPKDKEKTLIQVRWMHSEWNAGEHQFKSSQYESPKTQIEELHRTLKIYQRLLYISFAD